MKIPLIELNKNLNEEYIYLIKDILYLTIFIIISYFLNNLDIFIKLFKIIFIFILSKHLLFDKIIKIK